MLLGHAEPNPVFSSMMQALSLPGTVAYRRGNPPETAEPPKAEDPKAWIPVVPPPGRMAPPRAKTPPVPPKPKTRLQPRQSPAPHDPGDLRGAVRAKADAGDFAGAHELCLRALERQPLEAALHFYQGLILQALGRPAEAERSFLNGIYLDKSFAMAHYHLGLLLLAQGRSGPGRRSLANAARIASAMPGAQVLEEADGLTANELQNLVRIHLAAERKGRP